MGKLFHWISLIFCLILCACGPAVPTLRSESQMQTEVAITVQAMYPNKQTETILPGIVLPPTWTPLPASPTPTATQTPLVSFTPLPSSTAADELALILTNTPVYFPQNQSFEGVGDFTSPRFTLPVGSVKISWNYVGAPNEAENLRVIEQNHERYLDQLKDWYRTSKNYLEDLLDKAIKDQDEDRIEELEEELEDLEDEYEAEVKKENKRYQDEKELYQTNFKLTINKQLPASSKVLVSKSGPNSGSVTYNSAGGYDFTLTVDTTGSWEVSITP